MPTGYTYNVEDGTLTEFKAFAMQCARAFGALVTMRDAPNDAAIPEEFKPDDYYRNDLDKATKGLAELNQMTAEEIVAAASAANDADEKSHKEYLEARALENGRHEAMIEKVRAWKPPTDDHFGLKNFMIDQLSMSMRHYRVDPPERLLAEQWKAKQVKEFNRRIDQSTKGHAEEVERCRSRTEWVKALRASLE